MAAIPHSFYSFLTQNNLLGLNLEKRFECFARFDQLGSHVDVASRVRALLDDA